VVRASLLSRFQDRLGTSDFVTLTVTQHNRSALARDLTDLVIGAFLASQVQRTFLSALHLGEIDQ
jgi:hypothetical protein